MGVTNLVTLLQGMAAGTFQRLSNPSESTLANALPATLANFDFDAALAPGGSTWPNDASIPDSSVNSNPVFTWASACIDRRDGYVMQQGGGDQDTLRNAIMGFNVDAAAAAILAGGSPTQKWDRLIKDGRYRAGSAARPSSGVSPTGAVTTAPDPVTGLWPMTNADGIAMPRTVHPWFSKVQVPGTGKMLLGGSSTFPDNTNGGSNAGFYFDRDTGLMVGPLPFVGGAPAHMSTSFGYPGQGPSVMPVYFSDLDGCVYTIQNTDNFAWIVARITNPLTSSIALTSTGVFDPSLSPNGFASWRGIVDPANPALRIIFQHASDGGTSLDSNFLALSDPEGLAGGPFFNWQSYGSGSVTTTGPTWLVYTPDSTRGVVWGWDGDTLFQVTPGATLTTWSIARVTFTGTAGSTAPSSPAGSGALLPAIEYVPAADALIFSVLDEVWVFKPIGWSPPFTGPTLMQGLLLALWGTVGALPVLSLQGSVAGPQTFGAFTQAATMSVVRMLTTAQTIPAFAQTAALKLIGKIAAAQAIPAFTQAATLKLIGKLAAAQTIPAFVQAAALKLIDKLTAAQTVPAFSQTATMKAIGKINAAQAIPAFTQAAALTGGSDGILGAQVVPAFAQAATLFNGTPVTTSSTDWLVMARRRVHR